MFVKEVISSKKAREMNPVVLAFIGDAVYTLFVRENLALNHDLKTGELNKLSTLKVRASAQSERMNALLSILSEDETDIYKRARNAKKPTKAKSASIAEYNRSTGFEAVIGYLYLTGNTDRLAFLLNYGETTDES
ncbi:MAG: Mini-ribonuclease 3 [Clostridia bacterium]|nr:Mini-ribonuclease 3 [Clostridia bacterium]